MRSTNSSLFKQMKGKSLKINFITTKWPEPLNLHWKVQIKPAHITLPMKLYSCKSWSIGLVK